MRNPKPCPKCGSERRWRPSGYSATGKPKRKAGCPNCEREAKRRRFAPDQVENRAKRLASVVKAHQRHPERYRARQIVYSARRSGKLAPKPCEICGCKTVHAHHTDYSRPLDVRWLCPAHHGEVHRAEG